MGTREYIEASDATVTAKLVDSGHITIGSYSGQLVDIWGADVRAPFCGNYAVCQIESTIDRTYYLFSQDIEAGMTIYHDPDHSHVAFRLQRV